jgi:hypothetical protein
MVDGMRSGVGIISRRKDLAALSILFTFGALLNAFGMVSPIYAVENWLARVLNISQKAPMLGLLFALFLVVEPCVLLGLAAWSARYLTGKRTPLLAIIIRYSYGLVPLGFGIWLAHFGFHFLTGLYTFIPVTQNALASIGWPVLGAPKWSLVGLPKNAVNVFEFGFLGLGLLGSLIVNHRLAEDDCRDQPGKAYLPWAVLSVLLWISAMWLMSQPMQMRGTLG